MTIKRTIYNNRQHVINIITMLFVLPFMAIQFALVYITTIEPYAIPLTLPMMLGITALLGCIDMDYAMAKFQQQYGIK